MAMYVIGIGGTGAKCIEAITKLASVGLFTEQPLKVLFIDADETNGNLERSRNALSIYSRCQELIVGKENQDNSQLHPWMKTKIESFDLWSPFGGVNSSKELKAFFNYNTLKQNQPALGNLFDVLYTKDEQEVSLDVGFRGRPAIGSAVMSQVDLERLDQEPWGALIKQIQADTGAGKAPKVFLCGSMFGGTGASGLPTIARLLANKLKNIGVKDRVKIGCLFLLPYFGFTPPPGEDPDGIFARSEQFLLNTEAALRYYVTQARETFDTVFLLGNENFSKVEFSVGKNSQRNDPHFLELYSALAARYFFLHTAEIGEKVVLIGREQIGRLIWDDLPDRAEIQPALVNGTRFAYSWLSEFEPELNGILKRKDDRLVLTPWSRPFFPHRGSADGMTRLGDPQQQEALKTISAWCRDYLTWLYRLHQIEGEQIQLFNTQAMGDPEKSLRREQLAELVLDRPLDNKTKSRDTITSLMQNLQSYKPDNSAEPGIAALAKALYTFCKQ
jgi:hypothetical protein